MEPSHTRGSKKIMKDYIQEDYLKAEDVPVESIETDFPEPGYGTRFEENKTKTSSSKPSAVAGVKKRQANAATKVVKSKHQIVKTSAAKEVGKFGRKKITSLRLLFCGRSITHKLGPERSLTWEQGESSEQAKSEKGKSSGNHSAQCD